MGIIASVQSYDLNIPVGKSQAIDVAGDRVQFISATDPFAQIEIRPNFAQGNITLKPGQGMRFSEQVQRWIVFNKGSVALTGALLIGTGDFFDQRISGTVDVIDGGKARTLGNQAYMTVVSQAAIAAQYSHVQLWNPAGSGKVLNVSKFIVNSSSATAVHVRSHNVALGTYQWNGVSKKLGGPQAAGELRGTNNAAILPAGPSILGMTLQANLPYSHKLDEPIIVLPGMGIVAISTTLATDVAANFEWYEENA